MAASCMLVTNPSMSGPTLMLHNIDSSNGTVPLKGDFLKILGPKRGAAHGLGCIPIWGGFYFGRVVDFCDVWLRSEEAQPLPSSVWGSRTEGDYPYCSSLRRLHPRAWRLGGGAPLPLHQDRMLVSALPLSSSSPPSFPALLHLCLYLSLLLKMLFPSPVPQGSSWWKNKREGEIFLWGGRKGGKVGSKSSWREEGEEMERRERSTWLGGRKIISARRLCLRLKPDLHFKSGGRSCCHLRDTIGPTSVSFNVTRHRGLDEINRAAHDW